MEVGLATSNLLENAGSVGKRPPVSEHRILALDTYLVMEGHLPPTTEQVTSRAGVSVPRLFRYCLSVEELLKRAATRSAERRRHLFRVPEIGMGSRIGRFAGLRADLCEKPMSWPKCCAEALSRSPKRPGCRLSPERRWPIRSGLTSIPSCALSPVPRKDAVATLTSVESWEQVRLAHGRSPVQTRRARSRTIDQALRRR